MTEAHGMPMQGKLIASVLVPAQAQPLQKKPSDEEFQVGAFIGIGFVLLFMAIISLSRSTFAKSQRAVAQQLEKPDSDAPEYVKAQAA